ncbi:methionine adenosyltransferase sam2 [Hypoxylon texense]
MDRTDPMILDALKGILPEQTMELLQDHLQNPQSALQLLWRHAASLLDKLAALASPLVEPVLARVLRALRDSPDVVVLGFALAVFVFVLQLVSWVHRTVRYFTRLAFRLAGWALVLAVLAVLWRRGPEAAARDVVVFAGKVAGYAAVVRDIWWSEYQKFDAQTKRGGGPAAGGGQRVPSGGYSRSRNTGW